MVYNEEETRFHLIDPVLRRKGYNDPQRIRLETPAPVEPTGPKGRRSKRGGRTDYLLCVQVGDMPKPLPVAVLEAKRENADPLSGMEQAKAYADCKRFDVQYVFASNGHLYGEYDKPIGIQSGPHPLEEFPPHPDLCLRYAKDKGIDLTVPDVALLFQPDSPAWSATRYYQDAAIRAAFEKIILAQQAGKTPRVLLTLATGAGKTIIATNLLWRMAQAGLLPKPALFLCDRDELREQAYTKLKAAFGGNARIVETARGQNAAANARIHISTYQTLGIDDTDGKGGDGSFLTDHYGEDAFSVIIIDECHRSAWGKWSQVLTRDLHADRVAMQMNNLYARWCQKNGKPRKEDYAFKCTAAGGSDKINIMRGSGERAFIACTVDLLEAGVDIERLNAVVFFRYLQSAIKFYQMVGRGTRIHEETQKYKFWLYDYTGVTDLFGVDFITNPPRPGGGANSGGEGGDGGEGGEEGLHVAEMSAPYKVVVNAQGRFILVNRGGVATPIPVDEYRREVMARVVSEAHNLDDFRALWVEQKKRRQLIDHLLGDHLSPEVIRDAEQMNEFDLYDFFGRHGYHARALTRPQRGMEYLNAHSAWFATMDAKSAIVLKGLGHQFALDGTEALESSALWEVPEIKRAGGISALRALGTPTQVMQDAKMRLFGV